MILHTETDTINNVALDVRIEWLSEDHVLLQRQAYVHLDMFTNNAMSRHLLVREPGGSCWTLSGILPM